MLRTCAGRICRAARTAWVLSAADIVAVVVGRLRREEEGFRGGAGGALSSPNDPAGRQLGEGDNSSGRGKDRSFRCSVSVTRLPEMSSWIAWGAINPLST